MAPQAAYMYVASSALYVTDRACIQTSPQSQPALTDFGLQPYSRALP